MRRLLNIKCPNQTAALEIPIAAADCEGSGRWRRSGNYNRRPMVVARCAMSDARADSNNGIGGTNLIVATTIFPSRLVNEFTDSSRVTVPGCS